METRNNKKILFIITQSEMGGAQKYIYELITHLNRRKYDIVVTAGPEGDSEEGLLGRLEKENFRTQHLKYLKRKINPFLDFLALIEIYRLIKKEKPDIIQLGSTKAGILGSIANRIYHKQYATNDKLIYRIGGWSFNEPISCWQKKSYLWLEKITAPLKDIIITNSDHDRLQAIKLGIKPKEKIIRIYNGLDVNKINFLPRKKARTELLTKIYDSRLAISDSLIVGTIANLYPSKGLKHLIVASKLALTKSSTNLIFIVIGDGPERDKLKELIEKYQLENNFFLVGQINNASKYLKAFDIFVLPSLKEGFPWTILEAMAGGIPIIATKVGGIPEQISNLYNGILVKAASPKELSKAILQLINNGTPRISLIKNAHLVLKKQFDLKSMVRKTEELY